MNFREKKTDSTKYDHGENQQHALGGAEIIQSIFRLVFLAFSLAAQFLSRLRLAESTDLQTWQSIAVTPGMIDDNSRVSAAKRRRGEILSGADKVDPVALRLGATCSNHGCE